MTLLTTAVGSILNFRAFYTGIPRDRWTATNALLATDNNGNSIVTFIIFIKPTQSQANNLIKNWQTYLEALGSPISTFFGATPVIVPEEEFPELSLGLSVNLGTTLSEKLQELIDAEGGGIPDFTGTPSPPATTPGSTTTADYYGAATPAPTTTADVATTTPAPITTAEVTTTPEVTTTSAPVGR
jgi:hypothetical protein